MACRLQRLFYNFGLVSRKKSGKLEPFVTVVSQLTVPKKCHYKAETIVISWCVCVQRKKYMCLGKPKSHLQKTTTNKQIKIPNAIKWQFLIFTFHHCMNSPSKTEAFKEKLAFDGLELIPMEALIDLSRSILCKFVFRCEKNCLKAIMCESFN